MSKYTTELRFICENAAGFTESKSYKDIETILTTAAPKVFDFDFPIFDETYRLPLEKKILRHFYTREICEETVGLWKLRLCNKMNEIMPYYNKLYESELLEFNPFYDVDYGRIGQRKNDEQGVENRNESNQDTREVTITSSSELNSSVDGMANTNSASNTNGVSRDLYSDTPQGALDHVEDETYLTNARKTTNTNNSTDATNSTTSDITTSESTDNTSTNETDDRNILSNTNRMANSLEDYSEKVIGKMGTVSYSKLLKEFRETFLNIDMLVINDLNDLFINLW